MVSVSLLLGFFVAPVVSAVVYADASRRGLSRQERLLWATIVGVGSFGGFSLPYLFEDVLHRVYLHGIKSAPVVTSPREILALHLTVGAAISVCSVVMYGFVIRYGLLDGVAGPG